VDGDPDGLEDVPRSHPGFNGLRVAVRLRNALDGGSFANLVSVQLFILGGAPDFVTCSGDAATTELLAGDWVTLNVANCFTPDAGSSALINLKRIAVQITMAQEDAGATSIVLDVDNVVLTR
jgi:hypothetical protein